MCGIAGFLYPSGKRAEKKIVESMCASITHRGPDDRGVFVSGNLALGMQRLSIIDLQTGHQPIHNEDKRYCIVFNGEIYNYKSLHKMLAGKGHIFTTNSDTEVILHLYEEYGAACLDRLEGMFAIAIWDSLKKELFLARDRMGKKPLYYSKVNKGFLFGSEIKALLRHPECEKELASSALEKFLFFGFIPTPNTLFKGIYQVPAGAYLTIKEGEEVQVTSYWQPSFASVAGAPCEGDIERRCDELIRQAVEKRLVSDVPLGTFLSGGVDSSLVTALMCDSLGAQNLDTFTIGFSEAKYDESVYAGKVARHLGIKKHHTEIFQSGQCRELIPEILDFMDAPIADPSVIPTYLLSKFTRQFVKVALSGDGGDEIFAGYPKYAAHQIAEKVDMFGGAGRFMSGLFAKGLAPVLDDRKFRFFSGLKYPAQIRNHLWIAPFSPERIGRLLNRDFTAEAYEDIETYYGQVKSDDIVSRMLYLDGKLTFSDLFLVKVDRASMANSLEIRSPFLDRDLMEYVNSLPTSLKLKRGQTKYLLKKIASKYLPEELVYRKKMGFGIPLKEWIKKDLRDLIDSYLSEDRIKRANIFSYKEVNKVLREHYSGEKNNASPIWTLFVFQYWYEKHIAA